MQRVGVVGDQRFVGPAVPDAAAHAQEIVDGDPVGVREVREPRRDRIGDRERALLGELQDRRPDHRLGDAADAERILGRPRPRRSRGPPRPSSPRSRRARESGCRPPRSAGSSPSSPRRSRHRSPRPFGWQRPRLRHRRGGEQNERGKETGREAHGRTSGGMCRGRCGNHAWQGKRRRTRLKPAGSGAISRAHGSRSRHHPNYRPGALTVQGRRVPARARHRTSPPPTDAPMTDTDDRDPRLQGHPLPPEDRLPDARRPARQREPDWLARWERLGVYHRLRATAARPHPLRAARRPALRQRQPPHRPRAQQDPEGLRRPLASR